MKINKKTTADQLRTDAFAILLTFSYTTVTEFS